MKTTNKTLLFDKFGSVDNLYIKDIKEKPEPKDNEVRIKNVSIGIGRVETIYYCGYIQGIDVKFPSSLGYESSGVIDAVGKDVKNFKVGESVSVLQNTTQDKYNTNAEYCIQPEGSIVKNPTNVTHEQAASIWFSYLTAYFPLKSIKEGQFILITAAAASTGLGAIQIAKILGAKVIATSRSDSKKQQLLDFGADYFVNTSQDSKEFEKQIFEITNGKGVDIVYDPIGGPFIQNIVNVCAQNARIVIYGVTGGDTPFLTRQLFYRNIKMEAYLVFNFSTDPIQLKEAVDFITKNLEQNKFKLLIGKRYQGFDSIIDAYKFIEKNDLFGKVVINL
ncbi:hypothetical protein ACTFIU_000740 [Dictyostelium citrinum]